MSNRKRPVRKRSDRERLELFVRLVREFDQSEQVQRGLNINLSNKWTKENPQFAFVLTQPDENDLRVMLMTLRKFVSKDDDAYVQAIHGIVYRSLARGDDTWTVEALRADLGQMNTIWRQEFESGFMRLKIDSQEFSPESAMYLWLNGRYFHDDPDYAEQLDRLEQRNHLGALMVRWQFLNAVLATATYVHWLALNVDYLLGKGMLDVE